MSIIRVFLLDQLDMTLTMLMPILAPNLPHAVCWLELYCSSLMSQNIICIYEEKTEQKDI